MKAITIFSFSLEHHNKYTLEATPGQKRYQLSVSGLHQAWKIDAPIPSWMHQVKTSFLSSTDEQTYSIQYEKFLFGQILTRMVLNLDPVDQLPALRRHRGQYVHSKGHEFKALQEAEGLECRNNILRLITLRYLQQNPLQRPTYEMLMFWPSCWRDGQYLQFMVRFFDRIKVVESYRLARRWCDQFEQEVIPKPWFNTEKLGLGAFRLMKNEIFANSNALEDLRARTTLKDMSEDDLKELTEFVEKRAFSEFSGSSATGKLMLSRL